MSTAKANDYIACKCIKWSIHLEWHLNSRFHFNPLFRFFLNFHRIPGLKWFIDRLTLRHEKLIKLAYLRAFAYLTAATLTNIVVHGKPGIRYYYTTPLPSSIRRINYVLRFYNQLIVWTYEYFKQNSEQSSREVLASFHSFVSTGTFCSWEFTAKLSDCFSSGHISIRQQHSFEQKMSLKGFRNQLKWIDLETVTLTNFIFISPTCELLMELWGKWPHISAVNLNKINCNVSLVY